MRVFLQHTVVAALAELAAEAEVLQEAEAVEVDPQEELAEVEQSPNILIQTDRHLAYPFGFFPFAFIVKLCPMLVQPLLEIL